MQRKTLFIKPKLVTMKNISFIFLASLFLFMTSCSSGDPIERKLPEVVNKPEKPSTEDSNEKPDLIEEDSLTMVLDEEEVTKEGKEVKEEIVGDKSKPTTTKPSVKPTNTSTTQPTNNVEQTTVVEEVDVASPPPPPPPRPVVPEPEEEEVEVEEVVEEIVNKPSTPALSHSIWDGLLKKHVSAAGKVNYSGFVQDKSKLNAYLQILEKNPPNSNWGRNKTLAYWINVYNAHTVKLIVDNYPISSIMKLDGGSTWMKKRVKIGTNIYSLDQIEKQLLIKAFNEPRVHFAVNCAAKSCPSLLNKAWTSTNLESNFERQTKQFINNSNFNKLNGKSAELSKIFEWYAADFGNVISFINRYANSPLKSNAKLSYLEYNWNLNN